MYAFFHPCVNDSSFSQLGPDKIILWRKVIEGSALAPHGWTLRDWPLPYSWHKAKNQVWDSWQSWNIPLHKAKNPGLWAKDQKEKQVTFPTDKALNWVIQNMAASWPMWVYTLSSLMVILLPGGNEGQAWSLLGFSFSQSSQVLP